MEPDAVAGRTGRTRDERGIALVAVLWVFILLALIAASVAATTRTDIRIARNVLGAGVAEAAADAAVYQAAVALVAQQGRSAEWRTDGTPRTLRVGDGEVSVRIQDEGGKIDLNSANRQLLADVLHLPDEGDTVLAAVIEDWRDTDDFVTPGGAEDRDYARKRFPYGAKDAPFDSVDELRQVMGVTPQAFDRIAPLLTVYSNSAGIDPGVAPPEVLLALPQFDPETVDMILASRATAAASGSGAMASLPPSSLQGFFAPSPRNAFTVTAAARTDDGAQYVREAVVYLPRNLRTPYLFLSWRQGRNAAPSGADSTNR